MTRKATMLRRVASWGSIAIVVLIAAVVVVPWFMPWTPINCGYDEVDIRTGRTRSSWYLAGCKVYNRVMDSALSRALPRELVDGVTPDWKTVNTISPGIGHSPHHRFHGAISQIRSLAYRWEDANVDESTRRIMASHLLAIWQFYGGYYEAGRYIQGLRDLSDPNKRGPLLRTIATLTIPEEHAEGDHLILTVSYPDGLPMERVRGYRDTSGRFVRHGTCETWHPDGKRERYEHFDRGMRHGRGFQWDEDGKLTSVYQYKHNQLVNYESHYFQGRPEYAEAQRLIGTRPDDRTGGSSVQEKAKPGGRSDASQPTGDAPASPRPADDGKAGKEISDDAGRVPPNDLEAGPEDEPVKPWVRPPPLSVHGLVIDATTKRAIPRFRVIPAPRTSSELTWQPHLITTHRGGRFDLPPNPRAWPETRYRVEAEGYRPSISRIVKRSEGDVKLKFVMQADAGISAVVRTPDGEPAAGRRLPG